jgi:hypothetical protein
MLQWHNKANRVKSFPILRRPILRSPILRSLLHRFGASVISSLAREPIFTTSNVELEREPKMVSRKGVFQHATKEILQGRYLVRAIQ